jgi:lipopolysaccharide/colanic/teichoic acid biosynthesis glycosyltransferase
MAHAEGGPEAARWRSFERGGEAGAPIHADSIDEIGELLVSAHQQHRAVAIASRELERVAKCLGIRERTPDGIPVLRFGLGQRGRLDRAAIRVLEVLLAVAVLGAGAPLWAIIAAVIRLESPGHALHRAPRAGRGGRPFTFFKYRTMRIDDPDRTREAARLAVIRGDLAGFARGDGTVIPKHPRDPRITRVGRVLRWLSLDEIPQFVHVLTGDMAVVGPRPYPVEEAEALKPWHRLRAQGRPGLTGLWQVDARNRVSFDDSVIVDIYYLANANLWLDLRIIAVTPLRMLFGVGSY